MQIKKSHNIYETFTANETLVLFVHFS